MPTGTFILGYEFGTAYLNLSRFDKRALNDAVIEKLITAFTKAHRKTWLEFPIFYDYLRVSELRDEVRSRIEKMDFEDLTPLAANQFVAPGNVNTWYAHYQPISTTEHRVVTILPLVVMATGTPPTEVGPVIITGDYTNKQGNPATGTAKVVARLTWGIPLPPGEREPLHLPPPHGHRPLDGIPLS